MCFNVATATSISQDSASNCSHVILALVSLEWTVFAGMSPSCLPLPQSRHHTPSDLVSPAQFAETWVANVPMTRRVIKIYRDILSRSFKYSQSTWVKKKFTCGGANIVCGKSLKLTEM